MLPGVLQPYLACNTVSPIRSGSLVQYICSHGTHPDVLQPRPATHCACPYRLRTTLCNTYSILPDVLQLCLATDCACNTISEPIHSFVQYIRYTSRRCHLVCYFQFHFRDAPHAPGLRFRRRKHYLIVLSGSNEAKDTANIIYCSFIVIFDETDISIRLQIIADKGITITMEGTIVCDLKMILSHSTGIS